MADPRTEELREMAEHRGLRLVRSRRRKPGGDFGRYGLVDRKSGKEVFGVGKRSLKATDEEVESFLRGQDAATWKSSAKAARTAAPKPAPAPRPARDPEPAAHRQSEPRTSVRPRSPAPKPAAAPEPATAELKIRKATKADVAALARLVGELSGEASRAGLERQMTALARHKTPLLVADQGGVVGFVAYSRIDLFHHAKPVGRIQAIMVARPERRRGIGSALLQAAEARLRALGCNLVEAATDIRIAGSQGFFRENGFAKGYRYTKG